MTIDILCKVVDNYGDIGVVYRLARAVSAVDPSARLRLVVDGLSSFAHVCREVDPASTVQRVRGWTVYRWDEPDLAAAAIRDADYSADPPLAVIEAFACGRPAWLEGLLFADSAGAEPLIVNLEYLSAEPYADELHRAMSLTRSPRVRKRMFMPGFTAQTGGLSLDPPFVESLELRGDPEAFATARRGFLKAYAGDLEGAIQPSSEGTWVTLFSYPRDYARIIESLAGAASASTLTVFAAAGFSQACVEAAWDRAGRPFALVSLPFLSQEAWDRLVALSDTSIVRGEDSLSRAALSGAPFLWHAYPQADRHHLVKVRALLDRMRPHFAPEAFGQVEAAFIAFNDRDADAPEVAGDEDISAFIAGGSAYCGLADGFTSFARSLRANGDLAAHLMTFLREIV